jgi:hypothetical protein
VNKSVLGWWFAAGDRLPNGDGRKIVLGETLTVDPPVVLCERGLHASRRVIDTLNYAPGEFLYRVRVGGQVVHGDDKMVGTERTALWRIDATRALRLFGCDVAEMALKAERKAGREPHKDSWDVVAVMRRWIDGKATDAERSAAGSAAWNAAGSAAWNAAGSAAWNAAGSAARSAAERLLLRRIREARSATRTEDAP